MDIISLPFTADDLRSRYDTAWETEDNMLLDCDLGYRALCSRVVYVDLELDGDDLLDDALVSLSMTVGPWQIWAEEGELPKPASNPNQILGFLRRWVRLAGRFPDGEWTVTWVSPDGTLEEEFVSVSDWEV